MGSSLGRLFRVTTFGESHGGGLGAIVEGCPPGIPIEIDHIQVELDRRRPGQSKLVSPRREPDRVEILSGVFEGYTLGTPIALLIRNRDARPADYQALRSLYRPSHADFTYEAKYGRRNWQGGGRASARETAARVAAGAIARQVLGQLAGVEIVGWVDQIGDVVAACDAAKVQRAAVERSPVRCPRPDVAAQMVELIEEVRAERDSIGGLVRSVARQVPVGLGDPVFDKLEADLAKAMLSIPAAKGFVSGVGFAGLAWRGSRSNDAFVSTPQGGIQTRSNHSGGIQGGISNGMPIEITVLFKPPATIASAQQTVDVQGKETTIAARGRHDPCVLPRAVPIVEAMMALVLVDHLLRQRAQCGEPEPRGA